MTETAELDLIKVRQLMIVIQGANCRSYYFGFRLTSVNETVMR